MKRNYIRSPPVYIFELTLSLRRINVAITTAVAPGPSLLPPPTPPPPGLDPASPPPREEDLREGEVASKSAWTEEVVEGLRLKEGRMAIGKGRERARILSGGWSERKALLLVGDYPKSREV